MTRLRSQDHADLLEGTIGNGYLRFNRWAGRRAGSRDVLGELRRHLGRGQDRVHQTGGQGAARHAVELGGVRALDHDPPRLDDADLEGPVAAGSRQDDADGTGPEVLSERAKEEVDGHPVAAGGHRLNELQGPMMQSHVAVGGDDVDRVDLHALAIGGLANRQLRTARDELGQDALVVWREVLHEHVGHAWVLVVREAGEEGLEGGETTRGRADPHHREAQGLIFMRGGLGLVVALRLAVLIVDCHILPLGKGLANH